MPLFAALYVSSYVALQSRGESERNGVESRLMLVRARLEKEIFARIAVESGVASLFELRSSLTAQEFERYASLLVNGDPAIRNVSIIRDTTIVMVYPYESNKTALGRDLALVPAQAEALLRAKRTGKTVVTGPVNLVQGGRGLVARMPVRSFAADGSVSYWGQVGLVIDLDNLLTLAETFADSSLRVFLRDSGNPSVGIFAGDPETARENPVYTSVSVPDSQWELGAVPVKGWQHRFRLYLAMVLLAALIAGTAGLMASYIVATRQKMKELAHFDFLTGLPNRKMFWDRFRIAAALASRRQIGMLVLMLDLDGFKEVNDRYGHAAGDRLLRAVGNRLSLSMRAGDTVARFGGDEFVVLASMDEDQGTVERLGRRIEEVFSEPSEVPVPGYQIKASYGVAVWPEDGATGEEVLEAADRRMYEMKRERGFRR